MVLNLKSKVNRNWVVPTKQGMYYKSISERRVRPTHLNAIKPVPVPTRGGILRDLSLKIRPTRRPIPRRSL